MSGTPDLVVAGGVQKMSQFPISERLRGRRALRQRPIPWTGCRGLAERYGDQEISQFRGAEMIADAVEPEPRGQRTLRLGKPPARARGHREGYFEREISPTPASPIDEGPAPTRRWRRWPRCRPLDRGRPAHRRRAPARSPTAPPRCSSPLQDAVERSGLTPRARIHHMSVRGCRSRDDADRADPGDPARAEAPGMSIDDIDARRDQRGVRAGGAGVAGRTRRRPRAGQPQRRRHRAGPSDRLHRGAPDDNRCCTSWSAPAAGTACRRCARAAARPTSPSSSGSDR